MGPEELRDVFLDFCAVADNPGLFRPEIVTALLPVLPSLTAASSAVRAMLSSPEATVLVASRLPPDLVEEIRALHATVLLALETPT